MILLKDKFLKKLKYFCGTDEEWVNLIKKVRDHTKGEIIVCDSHPMSRNYPKDVKVIRSINTAKRVLYFSGAIVFLYCLDNNIFKKFDNYLSSRLSQFYCAVQERVALHFLINKNTVHLTVKEEKAIGRFWC